MRIPRLTNPRPLLVTAGAGVLLASAAGAVAVASATPVALSVDGQVRDLRTHADTVGDVLADEGVELATRDVVTPAVTTKLQDGDVIAVRYARPITVVVDGVERTEWTYADNVSDALTAMGLRSSQMQLSVSRSMGIGRDGAAFNASLPKTVTLVVDGEKEKVRTAAVDVEALLAQQAVDVGPEDAVSAALTDPLENGDRVTVAHTVSTLVTEKVDVANKTQRRSTASLYKGQTKVAKAGADGRATQTVRVVTVGGEKVSRTVVKRTVTTKPATRVVLVGTKSRPAATSSSSGSSSSGASSSGGSSGGAVSGGPWDALAQCESGGNWSISTGNGYYGGLQFTASTWHAYGGSGLPNQASRAEQIRIASKVRDAAGGYGAWPACAAKLGLPR